MSRGGRWGGEGMRRGGGEDSIKEIASGLGRSNCGAPTKHQVVFQGRNGGDIAYFGTSQSILEV